MIEDKRLLQQTTRFASQRSHCWGRAKETTPDRVFSFRYHEPAYHSAHAVTDEYDPFPIMECTCDTVEISAKQYCRIRIRITTGITKDPELVMFPYPRVAA